MEIDLKDLLSLLWRHIWVILLSALLGGVILLAGTKLFIAPKYTATVSMYVYNNNNVENASVQDITLSQQLVNTYIVILKSNSVLQRVSDQLDWKYNTEDLRKAITASSIDSTEAFEVSVIDKDPKHAQKIANTIAKVAPSQIIRVAKVGAVEVIDYATLPIEPSSPKPLRNTVIGIFLGLFFSSGIIILLNMFDTTICTESDLTEVFNLPVIGTIPHIETLKKGNRSL